MRERSWEFGVLDRVDRRNGTGPPSSAWSSHGTSEWLRSRTWPPGATGREPGFSGAPGRLEVCGAGGAELVDSGRPPPGFAGGDASGTGAVGDPDLVGRRTEPT